MNLLLILSAVFTVIALYFVVSMLRHARRRRPLRATGSLAGGAVAGCAGAASVMLAFSYYGYQRLVAEQPVATISFSQSAAEQFDATVVAQGVESSYRLWGDEWQMDARVVTWKPPATLLGLAPIYQLDRLSGRYASVDQELTRSRSVHDLADPVTLDVWKFARKYPGLLPGVDAHFGTATYLPMADGARYEVRMTRTGLIARPLNDAARAAVGDWGQ